MKELDFDELDRAVNTLMGDVPQAPARQPDDDDRMTTLDIPSTLGDNQAMPAYTPPVEPTATPSQAPVVNTPAPAARRGGRFMDVVHPSSDMKTASNMPARPVSRQGTMISPILPTKQPETSPSSLVAEPAPEPTPTPTPDTDTSAWPDPLDMAGYQREPDTTTPDAEVAVSVPEEVVVDTPTALEEPAETPAAIIEPDEEQPLSTPFLSDAKVEKRPLGTNSAEEPDHAPVMSSAAASEDTPDAESQLPATPDLAPVVLPEELQTDVLSIESDDTSPEVPGVDDEIHEDTLTPAIEAVTAAEAPASASTGGPTSIQQQYKEQPSTGDQAMGGIYDTESLHQPLGHPAKKKSGWMWVIWVLVLLILGAAGGAAAYLYLLK